MGRPLVLTLAVAGILAALGAAAYAGLRLGGGHEPANPDSHAVPAPDDRGDPESVTAGPQELREAALSLVPAIASEPPSEAELAEKDCTAGVDERPPPCVHFFFPTNGVTLEERRRAVKETAAANGWTRWRRPDGFMYFRRGPYRARLGLEPDHPDGFVDRLPALNEIMVFDVSRQPPPEPPPDPSGWSAEKRAFVEKANAICERLERRSKQLDVRGANPDAGMLEFAEMLSDATDAIAALEPPPGDEAAVAKIIREFRRLERAFRLAPRVEGEEALTLVGGIVFQTKHAQKAARAYGITGCSVE